MLHCDVVLSPLKKVSSDFFLFLITLVGFLITETNLIVATQNCRALEPTCAAFISLFSATLQHFFTADIHLSTSTAQLPDDGVLNLFNSLFFP